MAKNRGKKIDTYISVINRGTVHNPKIDGRVMPMTRKVYEALGSTTVGGVQYPNGGWVLKSVYDDQNPTAPERSVEAQAIVDGADVVAEDKPKRRGRKPKAEA